MAVIDTDRLVLVPWRPEHVELLRRLARVPEVMTDIGPGELWSEKKARKSRMSLFNTGPTTRSAGGSQSSA